MQQGERIYYLAGVKVMPSFEQKYRIGTKDGQYHIFWDITALLKDLPYTHFPILQYKATDLFKSNNFYGNYEYAMNTNLDNPCIIAKLNNSIEKIIDGNHRLYKAIQLNINTIPCYVLPLEYHVKFIVDYNADVYKRIISEFAK